MFTLAENVPQLVVHYKKQVGDFGTPLALTLGLTMSDYIRSLQAKLQLIWASRKGKCGLRKYKKYLFAKNS